MIVFDGSPLVHGPRGVARALRGLLAGWGEVPGAAPALLVVPGRALPADLPPGVEVRREPRAADPRRLRARLGEVVGESGAEALFSPWSACPDLRARGVPVVALVHELPFVRCGPVEGRLRAWRHRVWLRRALVRCAAVVVPSQATRRDLLALHPAADPRVAVIGNAFDARPWRAARAAPAEPPYALMVGVGAGRAMARKKGLDTALAVWRAGLAPAGLRLVLVGRPALPLPAGVEAHADLEDAALRARLARASVLLYPSRSEGFGYPPLEALAAGVPVVASDLPAVAEVAGDGALRVAPGDPEALATGVRRVLEDAALRGRLIAAGAARAEAFAPAAAAAALHDLLAGLGARA